ncbi:unnamed protein product [Cochlearia groenlandica]
MPCVSELFNIITETLSPSDMTTFTSVIEDFSFHRIVQTQLVASLLRLFEKHGHLYQCFTQVTYNYRQTQDNDQDHINLEYNLDTNPKEDVTYEPETEPCVTSTGFDDEASLDIDMERSTKKARISEELKQVTPSYMLIPKGERPLVSDRALNNAVVQRKFSISGREKLLTGYEKATWRWEDDMFQRDMLIEELRRAVELAKKVMSGEMAMEDVGAKFYKCVAELDRGRLVRKLIENYEEALPLILTRLKKKLDDLEVTRATKKPKWKQALETKAAKGHKER